MAADIIAVISRCMIVAGDDGGNKVLALLPCCRLVNLAAFPSPVQVQRRLLFLFFLLVEKSNVICLVFFSPLCGIQQIGPVG